jgi:hypothetical protein
VIKNFAKQPRIAPAPRVNCLLHIEIARVIPEEKRARKIAIASTASAQPKIVDGNTPEAPRLN